MSRNIRTEAIVLKTGRIGDIHKSVVLLTPELGIIDTIAHGVYKGKGKLAGVTDPFSWSLAYLYFEPVKKTYKITDMECRDLFESVRSDLRRFYAASLWAEVVIRTYAGGEGADRVFDLLNSALHALDGPGDERRTEIQFLWRFVALAGFQPDLESCAICGRELAEGETVCYRRSDGDFTSRGCLHDSDGWANDAAPEMSAGARKYV